MVSGCSMVVVALVASAASARAEPAGVGDTRDARLRFRSNAFGLGNVPDRALRFRAFDGLPASRAPGEYWLARIAGGRLQITATFELTGISGLLVRSSALSRAKRERDLDHLGRRLVFEFSPPLPIDVREGRVHR